MYQISIAAIYKNSMNIKTYHRYDIINTKESLPQ